MWVVKVNRNDLLGDRVLESTCALVSMSPREIKAITDIIVTWRRLFSPLVKKLLGQHGAFLLRDKGTLAAILISFDGLRAVLTHARVRLLEVDVHGDRLDVVQRILLIEWQTEVTLVLHLWPCNVLFYGMWCVLTGADIDSWI